MSHVTHMNKSCPIHKKFHETSIKNLTRHLKFFHETPEIISWDTWKFHGTPGKISRNTWKDFTKHLKNFTRHLNISRDTWKFHGTPTKMSWDTRWITRMRKWDMFIGNGTCL